MRLLEWGIVTDKTSVNAKTNTVSNAGRSTDLQRTPRATTNAPAHPSAIPPSIMTQTESKWQKCDRSKSKRVRREPAVSDAGRRQNTSQRRTMASSAPTPPCRRPSTTNGPRTYARGAPTSSMISISSSRAVGGEPHDVGDRHRRGDSPAESRSRGRARADSRTTPFSRASQRRSYRTSATPFSAPSERREVVDGVAGLLHLGLDPHLERRRKRIGLEAIGRLRRDPENPA